MAEQPMPKSPPGLFAKRRHQAKLQILEREIDFLQEELKSLDKVQPTSRSCKEINEFITAKSDPFIALDQESSQSDCCSCSCRGNRKKSCCKSSWNCCFSGCCRSDNERKGGCCKGWKSSCCSRKNCCPKGCCPKGCCSCISKHCCLFKLCSTKNNCCCKVKPCPSCVPSCGFCC